MKCLLRNCNKKEQINCIKGKTDPLEIVNKINHFFSTIGSTLANNIRPSQIDLNFDNVPNIPLLELHHTTPEEVAKFLLKISDAKATSEDGIPIRFLKMTTEISSVIISHIINLTIDTGVIPAGWKTAVITPLFKDGDRMVASNYHPISILPAFIEI